MTYPETLPPSNRAVGTPDPPADNNLLVTAVSHIDVRLNAVEYVTVRAVTASTTLVLADVGVAVEMTSAAGTTITVPPNSSVAFPVGSVIAMTTFGTGTCTVVAGGGVTINSRGGSLVLAAQYSSASLRKRATDTWILEGDLA